MAGYEAGKFGYAIMVARLAHELEPSMESMTVDEWENPTPVTKALTSLADEVDFQTASIAGDARTVSNMFARFAETMVDSFGAGSTTPMESSTIADMQRAVHKLVQSRAMLARFFRAHFGYRIDLALEACRAAGVHERFPADVVKENLDRAAAKLHEIRRPLVPVKP